MKTKIFSAMAALIAVALIAGCQGSSNSSSRTTSKIRCGLAIASWYKHGGRSDVVILEKQFKPLLADTKSHKRGAVRRDAAGVEAAANTLKSHEPPNCVPRADGDLTNALTDISNAAKAATAGNASKVKSSLLMADDSLRNAVGDVRAYAHS